MNDIENELIPELGEVAVWVCGADEDGLVLAHAGVDEEEGGVVEGDGRGGVPVGVLMLPSEELHEGLTDLFGGQLRVGRHGEAGAVRFGLLIFNV